MKSVLLSFAGVLLTLGGIYVMFIFISGIADNVSIFVLVGSLVMICGGVFLLITAGKLDTMILPRASKTEDDHTSVIPTKKEELALDKATVVPGKLDEKNRLLAEWKKTNETKNRLRMLEISAAANDE